MSVPRGTAPRGSEPDAHAKRRQRAQAFIYEMVRLGASDADANYIRSRTETYLEGAPVTDAGGPTDAELDAEFDAYLTHGLRPQVLARIAAHTTGLPPEFFDTTTAHELTPGELRDLREEKAARAKKKRKRRTG